MEEWSDCPNDVGGYTLGPTICRGPLSLVREAQDTASNRPYAMKIIPKSLISTPQGIDAVNRHIRALTGMQHVGIVKVYTSFSDDLYIYLVMDRFSAENALINVAESGLISEAFARSIFVQLLKSVTYMHSSGIPHRGLTTQSVVCDNGHVKIIDFGFAQIAAQCDISAIPEDEIPFCAPEVLENHLVDTLAADMWSCGVILFRIVVKSLPWPSGPQGDVVQAITAGRFQVPDAVGTLCAPLIRGLMEMKPKMRFTAEQAITHPWLGGPGTNCAEPPGGPVGTRPDSRQLSFLAQTGSWLGAKTRPKLSKGMTGGPLLSWSDG
jgi:serine/threonine protein kinase